MKADWFHTGAAILADDRQLEVADADLAPPSTQKVFKYSEQVHKDRHIFLGRAYVSMNDMNNYDHYSLLYDPLHLPSLSKVSLSLDVFHTPPQKRFNENINTYVDTRKRIRMVQSVEDFDRRSGCSPLPSEERINILGCGLLRTKTKDGASPEESSRLPPLKGAYDSLDQTSFPFKLHKEKTFSFTSAMPVRFTMKPMSLWRQRTDTFLHGRKLNIQRRINIQGH